MGYAHALVCERIGAGCLAWLSSNQQQFFTQANARRMQRRGSARALSGLARKLGRRLCCDPLRPARVDSERLVRRPNQVDEFMAAVIRVVALCWVSVVKLDLALAWLDRLRRMSRPVQVQAH